MKFKNIKMVSISIVLLISNLSLLSGTPLGAETLDYVPMNSLKDKTSYSLGVHIGKQFNEQELKLDLQVFIKGIEDAYNTKTPVMKEAEMLQTLDTLKKYIGKVYIKKNEINKKAGEAFLAKNRTKKGVVTLESGVQYEVIKAGKGANPLKSDTVSANFIGTTIDGEEFLSSFNRRLQPSSFAVGRLIKGWAEALQLMSVGAKWKIYIPSELGFGARGTEKVDPGSVLIIEIELLSINKKDLYAPN